MAGGSAAPFSGNPPNIDPFPLDDLHKDLSQSLRGVAAAVLPASSEADENESMGQLTQFPVCLQFQLLLGLPRLLIRHADRDRFNHSCPQIL